MGVAQRSRRWLVPVTAVAVVAGVGTLGPVVADASPNLPGITAQELLTKVQTAKVDGLSGTVRSAADLGLPALPGVEGGSQIPDLLTGEHTARVAFAAPDKARVAVLDNMAERVWTTDGKTAWAYDSAEREAVKLTLPARAHRPAGPELKPESYNPATVAKQFLDAIDPTTQVEVSGTDKVAGRDAYMLRLVPKTDKSTVGSVTLAIDSKNWVPLEVTVMPRTGKDPAAQLGFSSVSFGIPATSTFTFTPPKGVKVTEKSVPAVRQAPTPVKPPKAVTPKRPAQNAGDKPTVIGEGWESVVAFRDLDVPRSGPVGQLLANARTVEGSWGKGKILTSKMVNALITDDGRVLVGLVSPDTLVAAAPKAPR
ncbi:outer membrane lipoprotein carrier protein LolA [Kribbella turkmenica]|uniref:Outer membrane lipoprotein carrier protein LolA n=1 Tax=Kribbella turkmenica TaxID=2530375 RepID=A0A4R4WUE9_9ACTN|nr:outer membrane lipoprotein carrier protein LolA [Kribbella turkmenica]TDD21270.1 outer membrane lipoprotein carrier protein LolA [Kribbella turkmenica]